MSIEPTATAQIAASVLNDRLLSTRTVAALLEKSPAALRSLRHRGEGPEFIRLSRNCIRYRLSAVNRWIEEKQKAKPSSARAPAQALTAANG